MMHVTAAAAAPEPYVIAAKALEQIRACGQMPDPPTFELWFTYFSGSNEALNREVDADRDNRLSPARLRAIYNRHLSPHRHLEQLISFGKSLGEESQRVRTAVAVANDSAGSYGVELQGTLDRLEAAPDIAPLSEVVEALVRSTAAIKATNALLQSQLAQSESQVAQLQQSMEAIRLESMTDPLTRLANRRFFDFSLSELAGRGGGDKPPLSLLLVDIDHFKRFNDDFGHATGDDVLRLVAFTLRNSVRQSDLVARYGGDEFAIILPNTRAEDALAIGEQIRRAVADRPLLRRATKENLGRVTLSIGVAEHVAGALPEALLEEADRRLYAAKANGRNCAVG